jgi:uncharacterized membrane protein YgcG
MRRKVARTAVTGLGMLLGLMLMNSMLATAAFAEVNINVNIGPPPPIVVHERPTMVYLPEPGMYVAVGVPYDIFFVSGRYYYYHGDHWFWASGYNGPWVFVEQRRMPPGLVKYKVVKLREYREREYRVYKTQGPAWKGKHFDADPGPHAAQVRDDHRDDHHNDQGDHDRSSHSSGGGDSKGGGRGKGKK